MVNKSKKNMAYTMLDATGAVNDALAAEALGHPCRHPGAYPVMLR